MVVQGSNIKFSQPITLSVFSCHARSLGRSRIQPLALPGHHVSLYPAANEFVEAGLYPFRWCQPGSGFIAGHAIFIVVSCRTPRRANEIAGRSVIAAGVGQSPSQLITQTKSFSGSSTSVSPVQRIICLGVNEQVNYLAVKLGFVHVSAGRSCHQQVK